MAGLIRKCKSSILPPFLNDSGASMSNIPSLGVGAFRLTGPRRSMDGVALPEFMEALASLTKETCNV